MRTLPAKLVDFHIFRLFGCSIMSAPWHSHGVSPGFTRSEEICYKPNSRRELSLTV